MGWHPGYSPRGLNRAWGARLNAQEGSQKIIPSHFNGISRRYSSMGFVDSLGIIKVLRAWRSPYIPLSHYVFTLRTKVA